MNIGIIGLGFVGLSFASVLASKGYKVIGVDVDKIKVIQISSGKTPFHEKDLDKTLQKGLKNGLVITNNVKKFYY